MHRNQPNASKRQRVEMRNDQRKQPPCIGRLLRLIRLHEFVERRIRSAFAKASHPRVISCQQV